MEKNFSKEFQFIIKVLRSWMRFSIDRIFLYQGCLIVLSDEQYLCSNIDLCYYSDELKKLKDGYFFNSDLNYKLGKFITISDTGFSFTKGEVNINPFDSRNDYLLNLLESYKDLVVNPLFKIKFDNKLLLGKLYMNVKVKKYIEIEKDSSDLYINNKFIVQFNDLKTIPDFVFKSICKPVGSILSIFYNIGNCSIVGYANKIGIVSNGEGNLGIIFKLKT